MSGETENLRTILRAASTLVTESQENEKAFSRQVVQPTLNLQQVRNASRNFGRAVARVFTSLLAKLEEAGTVVEEVAAANESLKARLEETTAEKERVAQLNEGLQSRLEEVAQEKERVVGINQGLRAELAQALSRVEELEAERAEEPRPIQPVNLAEQFRMVVEKVGETGMAQPVGGAAVVLKSLDVEVKGLITVRGEKTHVVMPTPTQAIEPGQLSTLRMSFAKVPVVGTAEPPPNP